jgi:Bacteriophage Sf6, terminase small subunit-like
MAGGRPIVHTDEVYETVLIRMENGEFLREIERDKDMPSAAWLRRKVIADPEFGARYAHARRMQSHAHAERAVMAAREARSDDAALARLKFDAERWIAGKLAPREYGDKVTQELTGPNNGPVQFVLYGQPEVETTEEWQSDNPAPK